MILKTIGYSNGMFHQIEHYHVINANRYIRINQIVENTGSLRLDGNMVEVSQRRIILATGYCEVKPESSSKDTSKTHEGLLRLTRFCKKKH
jgi:hypothetical protein